MNLSPIKNVRKSFRCGRAVRTFTTFALITSVFTATSVRADSVRVNQVVQTLTSYQGTTELKLVNVTQDPAGGTKGSTQSSGQKTDGPTVPAGDAPKVDGLLSGTSVQYPQQVGVDIVAEAEVEGTICDCGLIPPPLVGGFPKWPLLFLAAIPLAFIDHDNETETPTPTPTPTATPTPTPPPPTPTPTPVPEPASLLLLGSGLLAAGAGLRRRRRNREQC